MRGTDQRHGIYTRQAMDNFTDDRIGTNLLLWSEDFTHAGWTARNVHTVTADQINAPNGTLTADLVTVTGATVTANQGVFAEGGTVNGPYIFSLHLLAGTTITAVRIMIKDKATDTIRGTTIVPVTSKWTRGVVTATTQGATPGFRVEIQTDTPTGTFYLWGGDVKLGWSYTSYVPTQGTIQSR